MLLSIDVTPLSPDWSQITRDMKEKGLPYYRQALAIGVEWSSYQRYMDGAHPGFGNGHAILILHAKVCGVEQTYTRLNEAFPKL